MDGKGALKAKPTNSEFNAFMGIHESRESKHDIAIDALLLSDANAKGKEVYCSPRSLPAKVNAIRDEVPQVNAALPRLYLPTLMGTLATFDRRSKGTGSYVADNLVLTALHVVDHASQLQLSDGKGGCVDALLVAEDRKNDLALLYAPKGNHHGVLPLAKTSMQEVFHPVIGLGYGLLSDKALLHPGYFEYLAKLPDGGTDSIGGEDLSKRYFFSDMHIDHGDSGGPVVHYNEKRKSVELLGVTDKGHTVPTSGGELMQNYSVPVELVWDFLKRTPGVTVHEDGSISFAPPNYENGVAR